MSVHGVSKSVPSKAAGRQVGEDRLELQSTSGNTRAGGELALDPPIAVTASTAVITHNDWGHRNRHRISMMMINVTIHVYHTKFSVPPTLSPKNVRVCVCVKNDY